MLALALKQRSRGHDGRAQGDDAGVALVVVLILMFLGAIVASAVAMMVVTTIQSTSSNKMATQEYVAAESGRDAAVATVAQGIKAGDGTLACSSGVTVAPGGDSTYSYTATVRWATAYRNTGEVVDHRGRRGLVLGVPDGFLELCRDPRHRHRAWREYQRDRLRIRLVVAARHPPGRNPGLLRRPVHRHQVDV